MSWALGIFGGILLVLGIQKENDLAPNMRVPSVIAGCVLLVIAAAVYIVRDHEHSDD